MPLSRLRSVLQDHFLGFDRVAIIGGLIRDLARVGSRGFRSDVDLVIEAPADTVGLLARELGAKSNRFGGYSYRHPQWKIDFWALEATWASANGYVTVNKLEDVVNCTFFNCDAVLYEIKTKSIFAHDGYLRSLQGGALEINLLPTPSVSGNLLRAVRRLLLWNAEAGPTLQEFIVANLDADSFRTIRSIERKAFASPILNRFSDVHALQRYLVHREDRADLWTSFAEQLPLPGFESDQIED